MLRTSSLKRHVTSTCVRLSSLTSGQIRRCSVPTTRPRSIRLRSLSAADVTTWQTVIVRTASRGASPARSPPCGVHPFTPPAHILPSQPTRLSAWRLAAASAVSPARARRQLSIASWATRCASWGVPRSQVILRLRQARSPAPYPVSAGRPSLARPSAQDSAPATTSAR